MIRHHQISWLAIALALAGRAPVARAASGDSSSPAEAAPAGADGLPGGALQSDVGSVYNSLSLEDLLHIALPETSVATKSAESLVSTSGTVYVITDEEIRRYGWRTLRDALSSVANMDLYWDGNSLSGGQRGFVSNFSGTLLLIDGREVQNLETSSTDISNNFPLHRVARIEILQSSNATLYGPNAKEGVINVVTKTARDDQADVVDLGVLGGQASTREVTSLVRRTFGDFTLGFSGSYFHSAQDWPELARFAGNTELYSRADPIIEAQRYRGTQLFRQDEDAYTFDGHVKYRWLYAGMNYLRSARIPGLRSVSTLR